MKTKLVNVLPLVILFIAFLFIMMRAEDRIHFLEVQREELRVQNFELYHGQQVLKAKIESMEYQEK